MYVLLGPSLNALGSPRKKNIVQRRENAIKNSIFLLCETEVNIYVHSQKKIFPFLQYMVSLK